LNTPVSPPDPGFARQIPAHTVEIPRSRPGRRRSRNSRNAGRSPAPLAARMIASNERPFNPPHAAREREGIRAEIGINLAKNLKLHV
jgi:hypothetical protein